MQKEQLNLQLKYRKLLTRMAKEENILVVNHLMPILHGFIPEIVDELTHSSWFWDEISQRLDRTYERERLVAQKVIKPVITTTTTPEAAKPPKSTTRKIKKDSK